MLLYDPTVKSPEQNHERAMAIQSLKGGRIGILENGKLNAANMLLKTAAIEYARRAANVKIIAFHPGTTDTALSKPFQKNVPQNKLFTPDFVAERLIGIMNTTAVDGELAYLDWDNKTIQW